MYDNGGITNDGKIDLQARKMSIEDRESIHRKRLDLPGLYNLTSRFVGSTTVVVSVSTLLSTRIENCLSPSPRFLRLFGITGILLPPMRPFLIRFKVKPIRFLSEKYRT